MKAEHNNIVNHDRKQLQEVIPLETPYSLFLDVCNICNFRCKFCAIQYSKRKLNFKKQVMGMQLFQKIVDDLTAFREPLKMLRLAANGEPLVNQNLPDMIRYAKERKVANWIEIVTNASLLSPQLSDQLVDAGLDRIRISIEAISEEEYFQIAGAQIDWDNFVKNIAYFYQNRKQCEVYIKIVDAAVDTKEKKKKFYQLFENMCDRIFIEHIIPIWADYEEINENFDIEKEAGLHGDMIREVRICPFPFYSFVINSDGQVTACCEDWERHIILGDLNKESVLEVWNGEIHRAFLKGMLKDGRHKNNHICSKCYYPNYDAVDNIDEYSEKILNSFKRKDITE